MPDVNDNRLLALSTGLILLVLFFLPVRGGADELPLPPKTLVITEVMYNPPSAVEFPWGQWIEIHNPLDEAQSLGSLELVIETVGQEGKQSGVIGIDGPVVPPKGFVVIGASKALAMNGGIPVDYAYGLDIVLPKQGGSIYLIAAGEILDQVWYSPDNGLGVAQGVSLNLEPVGMNAVDNDNPDFWCPSTFLFEDGLTETYATPGYSGNSCDSDQDGWDETPDDNGLFDCNDMDPLVNPGILEKCNGIDDNCDGSIDESPLSDMPVWPATGVCLEGGPVCKGASGYELVYPDSWEGTEVSCDGMDNDCDGLTDEGLRNSCGECGIAELDLCDGLDNDCDGDTDEDAVAPPVADVCTVGTEGVCAEAYVVCHDGGWECKLPWGYEAEEVSCDGVDNDCDGETDEGFDLGRHCHVGSGICRAQGVTVCSMDEKSVVCQASPDVGTPELCGDNIDNDCDGETDEGFPVGQTCTVGLGACAVTGKYFCSQDGLSVLCSVQPLDPMTEICDNGIDDDCDGETDEVNCDTDEPGPDEPGCQVSSTSDSALTILLLLAIPLAVLARRRLRAVV